MASNDVSSVKRRRLELGLTLQALADKCAMDGVAVTEAQLSKIERGVHAPRPRLRALLAHILGIDIADFEASGPANGAAA